MSKKEKLIARLKSRPKDFEFNEAKTLLLQCGYELTNAGKTSGSVTGFKKGQRLYKLHKPHPRKELLDYQIIDLINELTEDGSI